MQFLPIGCRLLILRHLYKNGICCSISFSVLCSIPNLEPKPMLFAWKLLPFFYLHQVLYTISCFYCLISQSLIFKLNFDSEVLYRSLKLWIAPIEDDTDSSVILSGRLLVVFIVDNNFWILKTMQLLLKTVFSCSQRL